MTINDEYGIWEVSNGVRALLQPTQKWLDENTKTTYEQAKTQLEILQETVDQLVMDSLGGI